MRDYCEPLARQAVCQGEKIPGEAGITTLGALCQAHSVSVQFVPVSLVTEMVSIARKKQQASPSNQWGVSQK